MTVSIIGYPYGLATAHAWPIWKTGHIASDIDLDYDGRPAFLIDATARSGMSGSPVVHRTSGGFTTRSGDVIYSTGVRPATRFLGVYRFAPAPFRIFGFVHSPPFLMIPVGSAAF
jgi:hypothetical protein